MAELHWWSTQIDYLALAVEALDQGLRELLWLDGVTASETALLASLCPCHLVGVIVGDLKKTGSLWVSVELLDRGLPIVLDLPNSLPIYHSIDFPKKTGRPMKCSMGRNDFANLHPN